MNKIYIYARPCVNTDFFHELMCPAVFFVSLPYVLSTQTSTAMMQNFLAFCNNY